MQMQSLSADLSGKKTFVTGSGQGMGQAIALTLAQRGATVMVHDRTLAATQTTLELIREQGGSAYAIAADFSECAGLDEMMAEVVSQLGGLDILVNNAGIGDLVLLQDMDEAFWDRMQNINLKAPAMITKYALETMRNNPTGGRLLYISSTNAKSADEQFSAYAAAKAGLLGFMRCVAVEEGARGITANAICPGWIDTPLTQAPIRDWAKEKGLPFDQVWQEVMAESNMMKSVMTPDDIAAFSAFLVSEQGRHLTAQSFNVCAGLCYW